MAKRPDNLAHGRWLGDFPELSAAESALVAACARGDAWTPEGWDGKRPTGATPANTIRAEIIRFLMLGSDVTHPVHEQGVMLRGAYITGELDLHQARCRIQLYASRCYFEGQPCFLAAHLFDLNLLGSRVPGILADGIKVTGDVFLRERFLAEGEVRLLGAEIGGILDCSDGSFTVEEGVALNADGMKVTGSVFLRDGFSAEGEVRLLGAEIGGNLYCSGGRFTVSGGDALSADRITVTGGVHLRGATITGAIDLAAARIGTLVDGHGTLTVWQNGGHVLDGLHYDRIVGVTDAKDRVAWLEKQKGSHLTTDFKPQPWEQLIKVLREMGHPHEAGDVAIAKQEQLRKAGKIKGRVRSSLHWLYGVATGYGHRPLHLVGWNLLVLTFCATWFAVAGSNGFMAPTNAEIITHRQLHQDLHAEGDDTRQCGIFGEVAPANYWPQCAKLPSEYTTFNSLAYSLDLLLPLVDLQQERDWSPAVSYTDRKGVTHDFWHDGLWAWEGEATRFLMWVEILFGWTSSLVLIAVLGRLVEKD